MRDYVYFAGKNLNDFNIFATNAGIYSAPARGFESIPIAGRNGNLIFENNKYENVEHRYPIAVLDNFDTNYAALKSFLLSQKGYKRLSDTFYPDEYYMATFSRFDSVNQPFYKADKGSCVLVFERKPQRYLRSGENMVEFTADGTLNNPTQFDALPLIRVYGEGTLTIGDISIDIDTSEPYLDIDCELQEVLQTGGNLDVTLTNGEFPKLIAGENEIAFTGLTKVEITPRWWRL